MTIAEKMADDFIVAAEGGPLAAELGKLITAVAERGREKAAQALTRCTPNREYSTYIQGDEAEFHIFDNKWEEEEA